MNEQSADWTERIYYLVAAGCQVAMVLIMAEHMGLKLLERWRAWRERLRRWQRQQEFEAFYRIWKAAHVDSE